jgi:hypothetical protein
MPKRIIMAACLALVAAGCGATTSGPMTQTQGEEFSLNQVGELCRMYQHAKKKPPEKLADLATVKSMAENGYEALRNGKAVLLYGATLPDTKEEPGGGPDDEVLAYVAEVPQSGGKVLMLNRTVKTMTADGFKAAKKAGKEVPPPSTTTKG